MSKYMRCEFYKILDKRYANDFIAGELYMNSLNYFRRIEGNAAQGDPLEGICGSIRKDQLKQLGLNFDKELTNAIIGNVSLISDYYGLNNVFCLYRMLINDAEKKVVCPSDELRKFNDQGEADKVVIRIKDTARFLNQLAKAIDEGIRTHKLEYGIYGGVTYSNAWSNSDGPGTRSVFHKEPKYEYQSEWRLCLLRNALADEAYVFSIGDLSDITEVISLQQFLEHPEAAYPGYSVEKEKSYMLDDGFRIFGSINAVNHLMYSYMAPSGDSFTRSDQAQADWHYTKYLQLIGKTEEIDLYLEERMKEFRDFDHLELLAQYRLSVNEWVKATDAFMFFIDEAPDVIQQNPARFFFPLHTILMQHKEAADAGKLYMLAVDKYKLPDDLKTSMQSDILFALGFYDKVIPIFKKMKETSVDPILDFYLAVSYLYLLDFEKADQHLTLYERYFSHSPHKAHMLAHLRNLVDCCRNEEPLNTALQAHPLEELEWDDRLEDVLNHKREKLFLGIDVLYKIEKASKWEVLNKFDSISVCPLLTVEILSLYSQTGDPAFFNIIMSLTRISQLEIQSPELIYYLAMDYSDREAPSIMKMEKALLLQEHKQEN